MWMDEQMSALKERISRLSDEELLQIVEIEFRDYRQEALAFAKHELTRRGIEFEEPNNKKARPPEKASQGVTTWAATCARCGGKARLAVLFGNTEAVIFFADRDEQRFLEVYVCSQCGQVQVAVDFETELDGYRRDVSTEGSEAKHRCPHCGWEPDPTAEWYCDKCGCYWNTFQTGGRCPKCNYQWTETGCDSCGKWSDHKDWYVKARQIK
jgi:rubrerythrin